MKSRIIVVTFISAPLVFSSGFAGVKAPQFTLKSLEGDSVSLADYAGKALFINFWATWCPPCKREIPHFNKLYRVHKESGFEILGISMDRNGEQAINQFKSTNEILFPVLLSIEQVWKDYQALLKPSQKGAIPTTFVVDIKGEIVEIFVGGQGYDIFERAIKKALEK